MKNISNEWFKKQRACEDGYRWVLKRTDKTILGTINELIKIERIDWANWTMARLLNKKQKIQYAIFAAEQVIEIYEKKFPDDKRPRQAIEAAKLVLKKNNKQNRDAAAYAAAYAAYTAAYAADAAAYAAAYAAYTAAYAADAAAYAFPAKKEMQIRILNYGLSLLN